MISWLLLRGRCRYCRAAHPGALPADGAGAWRGLRRSPSSCSGPTIRPSWRSAWSSCALLVTITLTDLERRVIPNTILLRPAPLAAARDRRRDRPLQPARAPGRRRRRRRAPARRRRSPTRAGWGWATSSSPPCMGLFLGRAVVAGAPDRGARGRRGRASRSSPARARTPASARSPSGPSSLSAASSACSRATRCSTGTWTPSCAELCHGRLHHVLGMRARRPCGR